MTMNTVPSIKCVSRKYNVNMYNVQRKYDVMHMPYHSTHAQCGPKRLVLTRYPYSIISGLRDTVWGVFRAPNTITCSAQLHQTTATKDGAQIERHLVCTQSQKE